MQHCTDFIHLFIHTPASRLKPNTYSASSHHMIICETVKEIYKKEKNKIVALMKKKTQTIESSVTIKLYHYFERLLF